MIRLPKEFGQTWIDPKSVALLEANDFCNHVEPVGATSGEIILQLKCGHRLRRYVFNNATEVLNGIKQSLEITDETQPATPLEATAETGN